MKHELPPNNSSKLRTINVQACGCFVICYEILKEDTVIGARYSEATESMTDRS